ncbi:MAG: Fe-S-binding domain-containing protein, partial [Acidobacteriaceae bacterium]|nr:Fe-S-binding domain-containing protein [Acidobacteriaceae bacterium]
GGIAQIMPAFATVFAITIFSSAGLPLLNGFIGEFTILSGAFAVNRIWAGIGVTGIVLSAAYLLWLYQRTMMGPVRYEANRRLPDLTLRERLIVVPLVALAFAIGIYPAPLFTTLRPPVAALLQQVQQGSRP